MRVGEVQAASLADWTSHRCYLRSRNTEEMQTRRCVCLRDVQMELSKRQRIQKTTWSSRRKGGRYTFKSPSHLQSGCHTGWFKQKSHLLKGTGWVTVLPSRTCKFGKWVGTMGGQSTRAQAKVRCQNQTVRILWISSSVGAWCPRHQYPSTTAPQARGRADPALTAARMNSPRFYFSESVTPESTFLEATWPGLGHMPLS